MTEMISIKNVSDIASFMETYLTDKDPTYYGQGLKNHSSLSPSDIERLRQFGLPGEYLHLAGSHNFRDVEIWQLRLTPFSKFSLLESLTELNWEDSCDFHEGYMAVASVEADNIYLKIGPHAHNDSQVYFIPHYTGKVESATQVASSFENLMLIFANFLKDMSRDEAQDIELVRRLLHFFEPDLDQKSIKAWQAMTCLELL